MLITWQAPVSAHSSASHGPSSAGAAAPQSLPKASTRSRCATLLGRVVGQPWASRDGDGLKWDLKQKVESRWKPLGISWYFMFFFFAFPFGEMKTTSASP